MAWQTTFVTAVRFAPKSKGSFAVEAGISMDFAMWVLYVIKVKNSDFDAVGICKNEVSAAKLGMVH